jgi:Leucine-rich repeat (LRR) protein
MYYSKGVPDFLSNLTSLVEFDCSYTYFHGPLRSTPFAKLKQLSYLDLSGNAYNSTIPTVFGTLPNLVQFYAQNAFLSGDLSFIKGMPEILELWVDQNSLHGTLPTFLGSLSTLASFSVTQNLLSGTFPTQLAKLTDMKQMWYYSNKFSGSFPNELSTLTIMHTLHLESNDVSGNVGSLCSSLGPPFGQLTTLGVDCGSGGKVTCPSSCTICCCSLATCSD